MGEEQEKGNIKINPISGFQHHLYSIVIIQKKFTPEWLSKKTGYSPSAIYKWAEGENPIPLAFFETYIKITGDLYYLDFLEDGVNRYAAPKIRNKAHQEILTSIAESVARLANSNKG